MLFLMSYYKGYQTKIFSNDLFVRIFYHNVEIDHGDDTFFNEKDIIFSNKKHKFCVISSIIDEFKIDGKYEFIIEYPNDELLRWQQTTKPLDSVTDTGYTPINVPYSGFSGLAKSSDREETFIDGSPGNSINNWYFAIGSKRAWMDGIPPYYLKYNDGS